MEKYNFSADLKPILKIQKTEIDKNINLLEKILFAKIKKHEKNNQVEMAETASFFLFQIQNSAKYKEKYLDILLIIKSLFNSSESLNCINNIDQNMSKIYDLLLSLDLENRMENSAVKNPTMLEIILANGVREWSLLEKLKEV